MGLTLHGLTLQAELFARVDMENNNNDEDETAEIAGGKEGGK